MKQQTIVLFLFYIVFVNSLHAQKTKIYGNVFDDKTKESLPFVNVYFAGSTIGATTDINGHFAIETENAGDSLTASFIGYIPQNKKVKKHRYQEINFFLKSSNFDLPEVVIMGDYDPAKALIKQVIKHKKNNRIKDYKYLDYEVYNKLRIDANNLSEQFKNRKVLKPFAFIFDFADTSIVSGKSYLPIFLTESFSRYYIRQSPHTEKEVIEGVKISGVENESVSQFVGNMFQRYDIYDNYIRIFKKNFISPVSDMALSFYSFHIVDTVDIKGRVSYKLMFHPKRKQELTFQGSIVIDAAKYAVKSFEMDIVKSANINYVNALKLGQDYELIQDKYWLITKDNGIADFNIVKESKTILGFYGTKTTEYRNFRFNKPQKESFYVLPTDVIVAKKAFGKEEDYWKNHRFEKLNKNEAFIYNMVDTLKKMPAFRTWIDVVETIVSGYYKIEKFEVGPYMTLLSFNPIEGIRMRFGGQTTPQLSKNFRLGGYLAYGTKDKKIKYKSEFTYLFNRNPRNAITISYKKDLEQLGMNPRAMKNDVLITSIVRRKEADKLSFTKELNANFEYEWFNGFKTDYGFRHKTIAPADGKAFILNPERKKREEKREITTTEVNVLVRFAYHEKFVLGRYKRMSLGTKYPIIQLEYAYGIPNFWGGEFEYHKLNLDIQHRFNIGLLGRTKYLFRIGKIFGKLPFPLLRLHPGNETFLYNRYAFNLMNYFEFISDEYAALFWEHHFHGLILDKFPLLRKLKWRLEGHLKGVIGSLSKKNLEFNHLPKGTKVLNTPYIESGFAVENIFKILKVSFDWRMTHRRPGKFSNFAVYGALFFDF
jgi:hypothetical protein